MKIECLECGNSFNGRPCKKRKFCSNICYRGYMAKRFKRWPKPKNLVINLPEGYDEFLNQKELSCPVEGCKWQGKHLSLHVNLAHGITADEFKRAAGFNLGSGIVSKLLAEKLSKRELVGIAINPPIPKSTKGKKRSYVSKETSEHQKKSHKLSQHKGPQRTCKECSTLFIQSTQFGRALFCSVICRDAWYSKKKKEKSKERIRLPNGTFIWKERKSR